jgi:hypothetical protein
MMWTTLINNLPVKPPEPKPRGNPNIRQMQKEKKQAARELVLRAIEEFGGATTAANIMELTQFSYKYVRSVCACLEKEGKLTSYTINDGMARRKYWKLQPPDSSQPRTCPHTAS